MQKQSIKGRFTRSDGYVMVLVGKKRYRLEHRLVAEQMLGRPLGRLEYVHHLGARDDNRPELLRVMTAAEHTRLHHVGQRLPQWSRLHPTCVQCGLTDTPHSGRGICRRCRNARLTIVRREKKLMLAIHGLTITEIDA